MPEVNTTWLVLSDVQIKKRIRKVLISLLIETWTQRTEAWR